MKRKIHTVHAFFAAQMNVFIFLCVFVLYFAIFKCVVHTFKVWIFFVICILCVSSSFPFCISVQSISSYNVVLLLRLIVLTFSRYHLSIFLMSLFFPCWFVQLQRRQSWRRRLSSDNSLSRFGCATRTRRLFINSIRPKCYFHSSRNTQTNSIANQSTAGKQTQHQTYRLHRNHNISWVHSSFFLRWTNAILTLQLHTHIHKLVQIHTI